nr:DUF1127 domain-containing protein [uncultured Dongia sp.]
MFSNITTRPADAVHPVIRAADAIRALITRMVRYQAERRAIHAVTALSDHMLKDLGIGRSQIVRTIRHGRFDHDC